MTEIIRVKTADSNYPVYIGTDLLDGSGPLTKKIGLTGRGLLISDENVWPLYGSKVLQSYIEAGYQMDSVVIEPGEAQKNWFKAYDLLTGAIDLGLDRSSFVVGLGGGVIGDLAGFVASIYMRGIPIVHIPTTLLAQSDSSVGGKVAVDHPKGKNLLGSFHQPVLVISDVSTLATLPKRELTAGMAEVIKYGLIKDRDFYTYLTDHLTEITAGESAVFSKIVAASVRVKADIVEKDEEESGERMLLNLGHTVGHALEAIHGYDKYVHGEAVAIGMITAMLISQQKGYISLEEVSFLQKALQKLSLPTKLLEEITQIKEYLYRDKKISHGKLRFVLLKEIGQAMVSDAIEAEDIISALRYQQSYL
jgi:3-dehydroquinate synthase